MISVKRSLLAALLCHDGIFDICIRIKTESVSITFIRKILLLINIIDPTSIHKDSIKGNYLHLLYKGTLSVSVKTSNVRAWIML